MLSDCDMCITECCCLTLNSVLCEDTSDMSVGDQGQVVLS